LIILLKLMKEPLVLDAAFMENVVPDAMNKGGSEVALQITPDFSVVFQPPRDVDCHLLNDLERPRTAKLF
jgi:hypothetical protein